MQSMYYIGLDIHEEAISQGLQISAHVILSGRRGKV
jgi:hypothetical protein